MGIALARRNCKLTGKLSTMRFSARPPPGVRMPRESSREGLTVGLDFVEIAQVARSIEAFGERYLRRVFTAGELAYCLGGRRDPAPHLAARFAAKEATFKALGQGGEPTDWRSVDVHRRPDGGCSVVLHGETRLRAERLGVGELSVSMSHDAGYATAVVVGERVHRQRRPPSRLARKGPRGAYER